MSRKKCLFANESYTFFVSLPKKHYTSSCSAMCAIPLSVSPLLCLPQREKGCYGGNAARGGERKCVITDGKQTSRAGGGMGMVWGKGLFWGKVVQYQHAHVMRGRGIRRLWGGSKEGG